MINGQVVADKMMIADYNGKILNIDERNNNEFTHVTLDNKHIKKLLGQKTSSITLLDRLHMDYTKRREKRNKKNKKHRKTSKKTSRKTSKKPKKRRR